MSVARRLMILLILPILLQVGLVAVLLVLDDRAAQSAQQAREQTRAIHIIDDMIVDFGLAIVAIFTRVTDPTERPENTVVTPDQLRERFVANAHKPNVGLIEADTYQKRFLAQIKDLRECSGDDPASLAAVDKAEATVREQYRLLKSMEKNPSWQRDNSPFTVLQRLGAIKKSAKSMLAFFDQFKILTTERYAKQQVLLNQENQQRESIRTFIIFALGFEAIAAFVAVFLFGKSLTGRLKQLVSNADCLPKLGELPFQVQGKDEIAHLDNVLHQAAHELRTSTAVKTNLLNMVAHDIRSPVMAAKLSLSKLLTTPAAEAETQRVNGERLLRIFSTINVLIDDLLTFQKLDNSRIDLNFQRISIDKLIAETIEEVRPLAQEKEIELKAELNQVPPIICDGVRLAQVLRNYLTNAIKFSNNNSTITVKDEEEAEFVRVSVVDQGRGITDSDKSALFEQFTQSTADDAKLGFGLGLHICKTIIELHGGQVGSNSNSAAGSTFWLTLPKDQEPD